MLDIGHQQELKRHFGILSLIGLASTTTISWTGLGLGLVAEINAGGPGAGESRIRMCHFWPAADSNIVIYGFLLVFILQSFLGASLAEFVSSYPTEGGMYHWTAAIAPRRASGFLSFVTGWCSVAGCV
jgi:choline transport protein